MSFQFAGKAFEDSRPRHTLVLVGMHKGRRSVRAQPANALGQCLAALRHARRFGLPVCFLHDARPSGSGWIEGLAPTRDDQLFVRRGPSCFDSPYFAEATLGVLALAGSLARDAIAATVRDAMHNLRSLVFLEDAILPPPGCLADMREMSAAWRTGIRRCRTQGWIETTAPLGKA